MAVVPRFRGDIVTCSTDTDGRVVRVRSINSDVPAGSEPRGIVSWDIQSGGPGQDQKNRTLLGNLSQGCLGVRGDRTGH